MQKLIDEFDHLIAPGTTVTEIILWDVSDDFAQMIQYADNPYFFIIDIRKSDGTMQEIGVFYYREDALAYAARMVEKYQAPLTDNTQLPLND